ncbi:hypothetical protein J2Z30_000466 [Streptomyces iranensis]|uniref:Uncharacterized protein n=1 Tax=Streptomyces iranensis TaxID=576784 RepID=A0ABS4MIF8_9ACTN|nr:hypothetical protein [Streptomyces iranensis]
MRLSALLKAQHQPCLFRAYFRGSSVSMTAKTGESGKGWRSNGSFRSASCGPSDR